MENFKKRLYDNELQEIGQEMELAGYSNNFICYVSDHFNLFFENVEKLEVLIIEKLFNDYALKYDYTEKELKELNE